MTSPSDNAPALRAIGLTKRFGATVAVDNLELEAPRGELFGFLGPNGAGKSTTLGMAMGLVRPTRGRVEILGTPASDVVAAHKIAGALIEEPRFYPNLSARANLRLLARPHGAAALARVDELLEKVGLLHRAKDRAGAYSRGMKQRLGVAAALLGDPQVAILDEPSNGLDPEGSDELWALLRELAAKEGKSVIVSSHLLREVEENCASVAVMRKGKLVAKGRVADLLLQAERAAPKCLLAFANPDAARSAASMLAERGWLRGDAPAPREGSALAPGAWELEADLAENGPRGGELARALFDAGLSLEGFAAKRLTLRDLFLRLTSDANGDDEG